MSYNNSGPQISWKPIIIILIITVVSISWMESWVNWRQVQNVLKIFYLYQQPVETPDDIKKINRNIEAIKQLDKSHSLYNNSQYHEMRDKTEEAFNPKQ